MYRTLHNRAREWYRDVLVLVARLLVATVMLAHVYQQFGQTGFASTASAFTKLGIPIAIAATAFTLVAELVGSFLLAFGVLTRVAAAGFAFVMTGAIFFVHAKNGIFVKNGGWELVGMIISTVLGLAAFGPGRLSIDHLIALWRRRAAARKRPAVVVTATPQSGRRTVASTVAASSTVRTIPAAGTATTATPADADPITDVRGFPMLSASFVPLGRPLRASAPAENAVPTPPPAGDAWTQPRSGDTAVTGR